MTTRQILDRMDILAAGINGCYETIDAERAKIVEYSNELQRLRDKVKVIALERELFGSSYRRLKPRDELVPRAALS